MIYLTIALVFSMVMIRLTDRADFQERQKVWIQDLKRKGLL